MFPQAQFGIHDLAVEAFDGRGIQAVGGSAEQCGTQRQVSLLLHPMLQVFKIVAMQVGIATASLVLPCAGLLVTEAAIGLFLLQHSI